MKILFFNPAQYVSEKERTAIAASGYRCWYHSNLDYKKLPTIFNKIASKGDILSSLQDKKNNQKKMVNIISSQAYLNQIKPTYTPSKNISNHSNNLLQLKNLSPCK